METEEGKVKKGNLESADVNVPAANEKAPEEMPGKRSDSPVTAEEQTGGDDQSKAEQEDVKAEAGDGDKKTESVDTGETDKRETFNASSESPLDDDTRNKMFEKGMNFDKEGMKGDALKCYLKCLVGLKENTRFALLPQCLRNIGEIYYGRDEYDKAISFIQAEKLYYESVLIDDTELQKHIDEVAAENASNESDDTNIDALRATEYEQLAKLCMEEKQPQLALEYAGKCTKLRQKVYGDGHLIVQQTLDFFATVYAEVGKLQYTESMGKYDPNEEPDMSGEISQPSTPTTEPTSILRKRKNTEGEREKRVRFDESQLQNEQASATEERCARLVLMVLFVTLFLVLVVLGCYIYCTLSQTTACKNFRRLIFDAVMRVRYLYYHYTTSAKDVQYG